MARYIQIDVEEHDALPEGCCQRFQAAGPAEEVRFIEYQPDRGPAGVYSVCGREASGRDVVAQAVRIEDSGAGMVLLIYGGEHGLRLKRGDGPEIAEPYLLLGLDVVRASAEG